MNKEFESLLNKNLKEFVDKYVTSFVCWDLSNLFSRNTGLVDSVEGIVSRLGRKEEDTKKGLEELVGKGVLEKRKIAEITTYELVDDPKIRKSLEDFSHALDSRDIRLCILTLMLQKESF